MGNLITEASDEELERYRVAIVKEQERRRTLAEAPRILDQVARDVLQAEGVQEGDEWRQPTGAHDAYPTGWEVEHNGKRWVSLTPANVWEPGVSGWREVVEDNDDGTPGIPAWVQPTGAHDAYPVGAKVTHNGATWENTTPANVWEPGVYGWNKTTP